jgi:hypothetical protein
MNICGIVLHVMSACGILIRRLVDDGSVLLPNQLAAVNLSFSPVLFYACDRIEECLEFARKWGVKSDCDGVGFGLESLRFVAPGAGEEGLACYVTN